MTGAPAFPYGPFSVKQRQVLTWWMAPSPYRDWDGIVVDGSIRSGKTISFIDGFLAWSQACFSDQAFIISGKSIGALKRNVLRPMFQMLAAKGTRHAYHRTEGVVTIGSNAYYCFGANNEASQDGLQGLTAAGWFADEAALHPQSFVEQAIARCSVDGAKYWLNCNPENPYHFVKTDLIDQAEEKRLLHLHFDMEDNLTLSESVKARYRRMFSGVWYKRMVLGLWTAAEGAVYDMFDEEVHVVDVVPTPRQRWITADYGTSNPTVFLELVDGDGRMTIAREFRYDPKDHGGRQRTDAEHAKALDQWIGEDLSGLRAIWIDPSALSFRLQVFQDHPRLRRLLQPADNNLLDGIRRTATLFGADRLKVHRSCVGTIKELQSYAWDAKAQARGEDVPVKANDHGPDCARYGINGTRLIWSRWLAGAIS